MTTNLAAFSSGASLVFPGAAANQLVTRPDVVAPGVQVFSAIPPEERPDGQAEAAQAAARDLTPGRDGGGPNARERYHRWCRIESRRRRWPPARLGADELPIEASDAER